MRPRRSWDRRTSAYQRNKSMSTYRLHESGAAALTLPRHRMALLPRRDEPATSRPAPVKQFFVELKRRKVYRVAVAYIVVAWVLIQVATQVSPFFEIPNWTVRLVIIAVVIGFPIAVILAWAYDITPSGIKRTEDAVPIAQRTAPKAFGTTTTSVADKSIAVLPFENLSDDRENAFFADGVHDDILSS